MKLIDRIKQLGMYQSEYAKKLKTSPTQVGRLVKYDCIIVDGRVYKPTDFKERD